MLKGTLVAAFLASVSMHAFAGETGEDKGTGVTNVDLKDLRDKCAAYVSNPQMKQVKLNITCNELSYYWSPIENGTLPLKNARNIGAAIQMKGFQVQHQFFPVAVADSVVPCSRFEKVERKVHNVDSELTCEELAGVADLAAYCQPILEKRAAEDAKSVTETRTGEIYTLCPAK